MFRVFEMEDMAMRYIQFRDPDTAALRDQINKVRGERSMVKFAQRQGQRTDSFQSLQLDAGDESRKP